MREALNSQFSFFVGIDQTGAARLGGVEAKALPVAFVDARGSRARLIASVGGRPLKLAHFSRGSLSDLLAGAVSSPHEILNSSSTALLVDSVFGLPSLAWPGAAGSVTLRSLFVEAAKDSPTRQGYGLYAAAEFFASILRQSGAPASDSYPVRACETLAGANSVFRTQPYQKNIQCGTYRIWRDLGRFGSEWLHLRYFEPVAKFARLESFDESDHPTFVALRASRITRPFLFEAYPSLLWRDVLKLRTRDRTKVRAALSAFDSVEISDDDLRLIESDADHADACVLALGGYWLSRQNLLIDGDISRDLTLAREGWIAGLPRS